MGRDSILLYVLPLLLSAIAVASPRSDTSAFLRSAVETVPQHEPIAAPIRSSIESIPLRSLGNEDDERLPLRDAVEKRPISVLDQNGFYKNLEDTDAVDFGAMKRYYGAANHFNSNASRNDERLQQGNANLQEMQQTTDPASRRLVVCYLQSWAAYRAPPLAFTAGLVPRTCTHLHYAFATLHPHTYAVIPANENYDVIKGGYRIVTGLKKRMPGLRVLISVGGDGTGRLFSEMVQEANRRSSFINSAVNFLREHDFDGLDLHWVYPGEKDDREKDLLTTLLYELREKFSSYGFLLSTVMPPSRYQIEDGYELSAVSGATDYAVLQAWDMTPGNRDEPPPKAVQHSSLHRDPGAASRDQRYDNIDYMVKYIIRHGMAAEKLVLGVPLFGRSYTLSSSADPAPGVPVTGWGNEGQYTQTKGLLAYFEICMAELEGKGMSAVDEAGNTYAVFDNQWVTFDAPSNIMEKMNFVISSGLAGAAAWAVDMDDFRGLCGKPFPILNAISTSLNGENPKSEQSTLKIGSCDSSRPYLSSDEVSCAHFHFCSGRIEYKMICDEGRLYDPSTGYCGHQDVSKCIPGQSLRISIEEATRFLSEAYEADFEWGDDPIKDIIKKANDHQRLIDVEYSDGKKGKENDKRVVCYTTNWAFYRRGDGKFVPENIDTRLCTHVVYAYASLSPDELIAKEFDPWTDITNNLYERVTSLNDVKVLLGLGGWTDSAGDKYSRLVASSSARSKFIEKLIGFLRMHNFKGLHLDWNYPVCWQSNCKKGAKSDKVNFATFIQELSKSLHSADMELGVALSGYKEVIDSAYDLPVLSKAADFLSTMTYDYHGGWERATGHHTPLVPPPSDSLPYYSIEYAIKSLISGGADPKKLNLGLAFYGQSFRLAETQGPSRPGTPAAGPGEPGEFTKQPGMLAYYEVCYRVKNLRWKSSRQDNAGPYAYYDNQWVGYDDPKSIKEKVEWAMQQGLGGVTAWAIDLDDYSNRCCAEPSPLLRAAGRALGRAVPPPPTAACERPPQPVTPAPPTTTPAESDGATTSASAAGGDHNHGGHHEHQTTTSWPSGNPPATTASSAMTWWPQPTTSPATTSTTTASTTTTTTTRRPTTTASTKPPNGETEHSLCTAGEFRAADGECDSYLQCEAGRWRKYHCAPGLHWAAKEKRCDWPSFAQCKDKPTSEDSTATSTLAPMTSRPPPQPTTTTTTTTTTRRTTTSTSTTTTTTSRPTTEDNVIVTSDGPADGALCKEQDYAAVTGDCNAYLHCDGNKWVLQNCAPGLHWSQPDKHCDWPKYAKCQGASKPKPTTPAPKPKPTQRPTRPPTQASNQPTEDSECDGSQQHASASSCDAYLLCVGGHWRRQRCPQGLHWDRRSKRCDWMEFAMCETTKPPSTKSPMSGTMQTSRRPSYTTTTIKPVVVVDDGTSSSCTSGQYLPHPKCEKFFVCVNGIKVAQSCAPGLIWSAERTQCDFPSSTSCTDRRQIASAALLEEGSMPDKEDSITYCNNGEYAMYPNDCTRYRHCIFGKFEDFSCSTGLHWNKDKQICDWPKSAKCQTKSKPVKPTTKPPYMPPKQDDVMPSRPIPESPDTTVIESNPTIQSSRYKMVCYYTNWSWYRPGLGKYTPEDIDPTMCTHIVYGFAVLGNDGLITAHDSWADYDNRFYERVVEYKRYGTKVSLGLGGWNDSVGDKYSRLVNDPMARALFVTQALEFLDKFGFDGLDLDWEYPKCWQVRLSCVRKLARVDTGEKLDQMQINVKKVDCSKGPDSDKQGFADLVRELSAAFKPKGLLLSAAVSPSKKVIDAGYDVPVLAKHLDWIAVMTYDYHGQWDKKTGHVAPLYYHPDDDNTYFNANYTMRYWMKKGAPASKLVMGMPLYGQTFTTESPTEQYTAIGSSGLNIPAISGGEAGEYTRAKGFLAYYEICDRIRNQGWKVVRDPYMSMGPFAYKGNQWVSFDDPQIIAKKVNFIKSLNLAGGMVWALDLDDFRNRCGQGNHPLMNTIKNGLLNSKIDSEPEPRPQPPTSKPPVAIDDDLQDIEVRPSYNKPPATQRPMQPTSKPQDVQQQTEKPNMKPQRPATVAPVKEERFKVVCYYTNWAYYRPGTGKYTPSEIDPSLCTHIVYSFAVLDKNELLIKPHDTWLDVENKFFDKVVAMKNRGVRVLLGLGGWNDSAGDKYSRLVNNAASRRKFIIHAVDFLEQHGFEGLDLDWEYPKCWQANCEKGPYSDKQAFASLVKELHEEFEPRGLLLSAAVSASKRVIDAGYDVRALSDNLDWIALMTYDYHGQWEKKTGHVSPMYARDDDDDKTLNTNYTVTYWINKGAAPEKLVLGVPFYGQSFALIENLGTGIGVPTYAGGEGGDETRARGFLSFYEICERIRVRGWKVHRDPGGRIGPYATDGDQWVSFDDDFMARHKAEYARSMGLGGGMVWALDLDDFSGNYCGCGQYPLLRNLNHVLRGKEAPPHCELKEIMGESPMLPVMAPTTSTETSMEPAQMPSVPALHTPAESGASLEGQSCRESTFKEDTNDCTKYYLCVGGQYFHLTCPSSLYWNKNRCDWQARSQCRGKADLRLTDEKSQAILPQSQNNQILACYFTNWAYYRKGDGRYGPEQVDPSLCTHLVYSWAHLNGYTNKVVPGIPELDVDNDFFGKITEFKNKGVKIILGVGGLEDSENPTWSRMAGNNGHRATFINSALKFLKRWDFDGLQLAWQYPVCKQTPCPSESKQSEKESFSTLLLELSGALRAQNYEFSAMVSAKPEIAEGAYDHNVLSVAVDWLAIASNDYYASTTGATAYLVPLEMNYIADSNSFNSTVAYWTGVVSPNQLVIGVPAYARSYTTTGSYTGVGGRVTGPGEPGAYTGVPGFLAYYEMCTSVKSKTWKERRTEDGTYAARDKQWASYLRPEEVHRVASTASRAGLRGAALWALDLDDWRGLCGCPHPLLRAVRQGLTEPNLPPTLCL